MRRHSHWRQQQRDFARCLCSALSLVHPLNHLSLLLLPSFLASTQSHPSCFCKDDTWHCTTAVTQPTGRRKSFATPTKCDQSDPVALLWQLTQTDSPNRIRSWFLFSSSSSRPPVFSWFILYIFYVCVGFRCPVCSLYSPWCNAAYTHYTHTPPRMCECLCVWVRILQSEKRISLATTNQQ